MPTASSLGSSALDYMKTWVASGAVVRRTERRKSGRVSPVNSELQPESPAGTGSAAAASERCCPPAPGRLRWIVAGLLGGFGLGGGTSASRLPRHGSL